MIGYEYGYDSRYRCPGTKRRTRSGYIFATLLQELQNGPASTADASNVRVDVVTRAASSVNQNCCGLICRDGVLGGWRVDVVLGFSLSLG